MKNYEEIAIDIIEGFLFQRGKKEALKLNPDLKKELDFVAKLCDCVRGELRSRQTIAQIINDWKRRNPGVLPYTLEEKNNE